MSWSSEGHRLLALLLSRRHAVRVAQALVATSVLRRDHRHCHARSVAESLSQLRRGACRAPSLSLALALAEAYAIPPAAWYAPASPDSLLQQELLRALEAS